MSSTKFHRRLSGVAAIAAAGSLLAASGASASGFQCSASAVRGTVLTQTGIEPVVANAGSGACQPAVAHLDNLPAPLGGWALAKTDLTGPADNPAAQQASAKSGIAGFSVGNVANLPISLPTANIPSGLDALNVPIPATARDILPALPGVPSVPSVPVLPSAITVNALDAAKALVPTQSLPDLPLAAIKSLTSSVTGQCIGDLPKLIGNSVVDGLQGLGQSLPTDAPIDQAVTLLGAQSIPLTNIDLSKVQLPAGLSFDDPVVGPILKTAVTQALASLPPITIPSTVADVQTTLGEQSGDGTTSLEQRALRMKIVAAGQTVADLVMGIAKVATDQLGCGAQAPAQDAPAAIAPASQLAVSCTKQKVTLIDVADAKDHVALFGAADKKYVGQPVRIVFTDTGKQVATSRVRPDGFFRADAPVPSKSVRYTSRARYVAIVGGDKSLPLKLHRRMRISQLRHHGNTVNLTGRVYGPRANAPITISRRVSCTQDVVVGQVRPDSNGVWHATVQAPKGTSAAVYRATTAVRNMAGSAKTFPTFTLPGYVSL